MSKFEVINSNCLEYLKNIPDNTFDSIVTDPPYGLEFMGKDWDAPWKSDRRQTFDGTLSDDRNSPFKRQKVRYGVGPSYKSKNEQMVFFQNWFYEISCEMFRVLKPGGHIAVFGGTRTHHRIWSAIEDAGFEIRDTIMWVYGQGFPKSHDISKAIDKKLGAERKIVSKINITGYGNSNVNHGNQTRNVKEFSVTSNEPITNEANHWHGWGTALKPSHEPICIARKPIRENTVAENVLKWGVGAINIDQCRVDSPLGTGRFPANFIHDGSQEVLDLFPDSKGQQGDVKGTEKSHTGDKNASCYGKYSRIPAQKRGDSGSAARFFYCTKASKDDRIGSNHPTVKPIDLIAYLARLLTPKGGTILDPFAGSGTLAAACYREGFNCLLIEKQKEYCEIINRRIELMR